MPDLNDKINHVIVEIEPPIYENIIENFNISKSIGIADFVRYCSSNINAIINISIINLKKFKSQFLRTAQFKRHLKFCFFFI